MMKLFERKEEPDCPHHEGSSTLPVMLIGCSVILLVILCLEIFFLIQSRSAIREEQNRAHNAQIVELQREIYSRDAAIDRRLNEREAQNRKSTCAILSSIPPDNGIADTFRTSLKCGKYSKSAKKSAETVKKHPAQ